MTITSLKIDQFRCFTSWSSELHPTLNVIVGQNGSGKTSVLESIYYLAYGKSFRHRSAQAIIQEQQAHLTIQANCTSQTETCHIAIRKTQENSSTIREDGDKVNRISQLSYRPAVCYLDSDLHRLYNRQSSERRKILDWGAFHYCEQYAKDWRNFQRILKQRNAALIDAYSIKDTQVWDRQLSVAAQLVHEHRTTYFQSIRPYFEEALIALCHFKEGITLDYHPGWDTSQCFEQQLSESFSRDKLGKITHLGPQRGDFSLKYDNKKISERRSQGEQKILLYTLRMAQILLLLEQKPTPLIVLIDDIIAEIDISRQKKLLGFLKNLPVQLLVTCTNFQHLHNEIEAPSQQIITLD